MDCTIIETDEVMNFWRNEPNRFLTASEMGAWLLASTKAAQSARERAICTITARAMRCWEPPSFKSELMRRGIAMEPEAENSFEEHTGIKLRKVGFCKSNLGLFGCVPDGLIGDASGFEGKCPMPSIHIMYRRAGVLPEDYKFQVHGSMAVTGAKEWWFQSYSPGLRPLQLLIQRDAFTDSLLAALVEFSVELEQSINEERRLAP